MLDGRVRARAGFTRTLVVQSDHCAKLGLGWWVKRKLTGRGKYVLTARALDAQGASSPPVTVTRRLRR
jgi:hypothetical protein